MSGFLQRLAAQAMGSTNILRPAVHQPYAETSSPFYTEVPDRQAASDIMDIPPYTAARGKAEAIPVTNQHEQHSGFPADAGARHHEDPDIRPIPEMVIPGAELGAKPDNPHAPPSPARNALRQSGAKPEATVADKFQVLPDSAETPVPQSGIVTATVDRRRQPPAQADRDFTTGSFVQDKENVTRPEGVSPPFLLPPKNTARSPALNADAATQRAMPRGSALQAHVEETTEVHVSIGRIEVTAVHDTPPPKRQAPASAKPMSLDEYLARRKKEA